MDPERFDRLAMRMGGVSSRRGMLGLLATLPVLSGLFALLEPDELDAKGRRRRRKKRHKHGKRRRRKHKKPQCKPHAKTKTCAGKCGPVKNNCKKTVDCGPCDCDPPCGTCATCTAARQCEPCDPCCEEVCCDQANAICHMGTGACCVPDSKAQTCHNACGQVVNNCGVAVNCGPCTCEGGCPQCQVCDEQSDDCVADPNQQGEPCGSTGQVCQADGACACDADSCPAPETCGGGNPGTPGVCGCTPTNPCTVGVCGTVPNNCGQNVNCGGCDNPTPICVNHVCAACDDANPCPGSQCCSGGQCVAACPACQSCRAGVCAPCADCCADNTCRAGDAWAQCGTNGDRCAACARGEVCAAGSQTCRSCESGGSQRGTFCEIRDDFAKFQCAPNCACGKYVGGGGFCWDVTGYVYCSESGPICEFAADCVIEGLGDLCIPLGDCEPGCIQNVCVTMCGTGAGEGPLQLVVLD